MLGRPEGLPVPLERHNWPPRTACAASRFPRNRPVRPLCANATPLPHPLHSPAPPGTPSLQVIEKLMLRQDLSEEESSQTLKALIQGAEQAQMAAFLVLLRAKVSWTGWL